MENDPILRSSEKWYDYTREEMYEVMLKKVRRYWDLHKEKYFINYKFNYHPWWSISF
jgi:hypothetical protein